MLNISGSENKGCDDFYGDDNDVDNNDGEVVLVVKILESKSNDADDVNGDKR